VDIAPTEWEARAVYSALSVEDSSQYDTVKMSILKAYELVPEAYWQRFRNTKKTEKQTYVEFGREKEMLFDRWCLSKNVNEDYVRLHQLVLIEEFKNCLPTELKTYVDEQKVESVHQAAMLADDYALTHTPVFRHPGDPQPHKGNSDSLPSGGKNLSHPPNDLSVQRSPRFPGGPTCYYCKKKGHIMSECRVLQKKHQKVESDCLIAPNSVSETELLEDVEDCPPWGWLVTLCIQGFCLSQRESQGITNERSERHWCYPLFGFGQCIAIL